MKQYEHFLSNLGRKCFIAIEKSTDDDVIFILEIDFLVIHAFTGISQLAHRSVTTIGHTIGSYNACTTIGRVGFEDSCLPENTVRKMVSNHIFQKESDTT